MILGKKQYESGNWFPMAFVAGCTSAFFLGAALSVGNGEKGHTGVDFLCILIMASIIGQVTADLEPTKAGLNLSYFNIRGFYGLFFLLYYVIPFVLMQFSGLLPQKNDLLIACLIGIAYLAWRIGVGPQVRFTPSSRLPQRGLASDQDKNGATVLLALCLVGIGSIVYLYVWRTSHGIFFMHADYYEQALTVSASLRDVFIGGIQLPILIILGALAYLAQGKTKQWAKWATLGYGLFIIVLFVLSSQTRPAITAVILLVASRKLGSAAPIKKRYLAGVGVLSILILLGIQGGRIAGRDEFSKTDNQFKYALTNLVPNAVGTTNQYSGDVQSNVISRSGAGISFLSDVIDGVGGKNHYVYGRDVFQSLWGIIPRAFWPNKPLSEPPQIVMERLLDLPLNDAPVGPITQFYAWGGVLSLFLSYALFGWGLGRLSRWTARMPSLDRWLFFAFILSQIALVEHEVVLGLITSIRNALLVYGIWKALLFLLTARAKNWRMA